MGVDNTARDERRLKGIVDAVGALQVALIDADARPATKILVPGEAVDSLLAIGRVGNGGTWHFDHKEREKSRDYLCHICGVPFYFDPDSRK